jgi:hypothetical protein
VGIETGRSQILMDGADDKRKYVQYYDEVFSRGTGAIGFNYLCTYDLYIHVHNVLDACISITRASGRGLGPGN